VSERPSSTDPRTWDCQKCGACCRGLDVLLTDAEADQFESRPDLVRLTVLYQPRAGLAARFLKRDAQTDTCLALGGRFGDCACTIYAQRPYLCRELQPGDPHCLEARRREGFPVP
jgi:Fe-S-cluster containining protein